MTHRGHIDAFAGNSKLKLPFRKNRCKSNAMVAAALRAQGIVVFLDADLKGLKGDYVQN
jgi:hypothetical protein